MNLILLLHVIKIILFIISFTICGLVVNIIQCILYFVVRPYNKTLSRKLMYYLNYTFFSHMICLGEWYSLSDYYLYVDKADLEKYFGKEHAYIILNHKYEVDWLFFGIVSSKLKLAGNCKYFIKNIAKYVPAFGWSLYFAEYIFLARSFDKDKAVIEKHVAEIGDFVDPVWLILFPEGTRYTSSKHASSLKLCKEKGIPELKHHLLPKSKGFLTSLPSIKSKFKAIYDVTLSFNPNDDVEPTIANVLFGKKLQAHFYIKRIPVEDVPDTESEATKFLNDLFLRKDKLQESFFNTGDYFYESGVEKVEPLKLKRKYMSLLNCVAWHIISIIPILYYIILMILTANFLNLFIVVFTFILFFIIVRYCLSLNTLKKEN